MQKLILFVVFLTAITGCGDELKNKRRQPGINIVQQPLKSSPPFLLMKESRGCEVKRIENYDRFLNLFIEGNITMSSRDLRDIFRGLFVKSADTSIITKTIYGLDIELVPRGDTMEMVVHKKGKSVSVCPEKKDYQRESVESASMNASYFITKTNKAVRAQSPSLRIAPIKVIISPSHRTTLRVQSLGLRKRSFYRTDNAYYDPSDMSVTFLPHSQAWKNAGIQANFWEVPMVASHEYGHHIFQTILRKGMGGVKGMRTLTPCFADHPVVEDGEVVPTATFADKVSILSAYNEGFSDLIAFYSLSNEERSVQGVKCLSVTRDVAQPFFIDGRSKVFSPDAIYTFLTPAMTTQELPCEITNFQGVHTMGAVFAHSADKITTQWTQSKEKKLSITIKWAQKLAAKLSGMSFLSKHQLLRDIYALYITTASEELEEPLNAESCKLAEETFPSITHSIPQCKGL